ncbi:MAG: protein kinase [Polyangiales bacterium]
MSGLDVARWKSLAPHLEHALDLPSGERSRWLATLDGRDPRLASELRALLDELVALDRAGFLAESLGALRDGLAAREADSPREPEHPRYQVGAEHARGGMGRILRATDTYLARPVAIKELLSHGREAEARFEREARLTARLQHPSIVPVYDAGRWRATGRPFYAMKLVGGAPLSALVASAAGLPARLALLPHVLAAADAVAYAHHQGVIHRDLKAANVLVGEYGETLVVDWGLAKQLDAPSEASTDGGSDSQVDATMTVAGAVLGTPAYMPPEQARGLPVDARADVYALGALLYFVIAGAPPYDAANATGTLAQVLAGPPRSLARRAPGAPRDLSAIAAKAMARVPDDRYPSARELASDLRAYLAGQIVGAHRYAWSERLVRWVGRHRSVAVASAVFVLLALTGTSAFSLRAQQLRQRAEEARVIAEAQRGALALEHGRRELQRGHPQRASVYLAEAVRADPHDLVARYLLSEAAPALDAHVHTLRGHTRDVVAVAFGGDGARLVTGGTDQTVRMWDARTGATLRIFEGARSSIEDVALSPDGRFVVSVEDVVCVWDARTGALLRTFARSGFRARFSPDGRWLAVGTMSGRLRVWETAGWTEILDAHPHRGRIADVAFRPDLREAVTVSWDGIATLWALPAWRPRATLDDHHNKLSTAAYSADGQWLVTGDADTTLTVRDARDGSARHGIRLPEGSRWMDASFAPDGRTLVTVTIDGVIRGWHATSGALLYAVDVMPEGKMFDSALSPDGSTVASVGLRGGDLWRIAGIPRGRILRGDRHTPTEIGAARYAADGSAIIAGITLRDQDAHWLEVWDAQSGDVRTRFRVAGNPYRVAASADLGRVATGYGVGVSAVHDVRTGAVTLAIAHDRAWVRGLALSRDGRRVLSAGDGGRVMLWDDQGAHALRTDIPASEMAIAVALRPGDREFAVSDSRGRVSVYDLATRRLLRAISASRTQVEHVEYSADGRWLVTAGRQDHTARVWDADTGALRSTLLGHTDNLIDASFSPDGSLLATASFDNTARLWDARTGALLRVIHGPANAARFSPDGREVLTTGLGDYAVIWDVSLDRRSPAQLAARVEARSPWQMRDGRLVLRDEAH